MTVTSAATSTTPATTATTTTPSSTTLMSKALSGFGGSIKANPHKGTGLAAAIIANAANESKQENSAAQNQQAAATTAVNNSRATPVNAAPGSAGTTSLKNQKTKIQTL